MKTCLIALAASAAFVTAAFAAEMPNTDPNMQPAPAATPAPATPAATTESAPMPAPAATTASTPEEAAPAPAATASVPDEKAKLDEKPALAEKAAPTPKKVDERHVKYHNGEGSTWKTGRNSYGFEGSFGGCQFRGHAGPDGYHIDKGC